MFQEIKEHRDFFKRLMGKAANVFRILTVNYDLSFEDLMKLGGYELLDPDRPLRHFQITRHGQSSVKIELVHLGRRFGPGDEVPNELDRMGYRPADLAEGITFGATLHKKQGWPPIAILGPVSLFSYDRQRVAYLDLSRPKLHMHFRESGWPEWWRFLAVRKPDCAGE